MTPSTCKVPRVGAELHPGGSSFQSLTVRGKVCAAAEALVLEAVVASSSTCRLQFEVRAPHTRLTSGDLVQYGEAYGPASVL